MHAVFFTVVSYSKCVEEVEQLISLAQPVDYFNRLNSALIAADGCAASTNHTEDVCHHLSLMVRFQRRLRETSVGSEIVFFIKYITIPLNTFHALPWP